MKWEDIWEEGAISEEVHVFYERLMEILNQIDELQKGWEEEEGDVLDEKMDEAKNDLIQCIVEIVRKEEKKFEFSRIEKLFGDDDFWEDIKEETDRITCDYLRAGNLRQFDHDFREKCFKMVFDMFYFEGEISRYAAEKLDIEENEAKLLYHILGFSESLIMGRCISKRIFSNIVIKRYGLSKDDSDVIWDLFQAKKEKIENLILRRHLTEVEYKMSRVLERLEDLIDICDLALEVVLDDEKVTGE